MPDNDTMLAQKAPFEYRTSLSGRDSDLLKLPNVWTLAANGMCYADCLVYTL